MYIHVRVHVHTSIIRPSNIIKGIITVVSKVYRVPIVIREPA